MPPFEIIEAELIEWLEGYAGPRFHAILSDPPYALISIAKRFGTPNQAPAQQGADGRYARLSGGFMGQSWDSFESYEQYREWITKWAKLLIEKALCPGAVCLFFGGTRTWHHLGLGLEEGGFEIVDTLMWLYGCLDQESEILTEAGWKKGVDLNGDELVAQWNPETEQISLSPIKDLVIRHYKGPMIYLINDNTNQLLTPNHRVYWRPEFRKQEGLNRKSWVAKSWMSTFAGAIKKYLRFKVPLAGYHNGAGFGGTDYCSLLAWIWTEGGFDNTGTGVRIYQSSVNQAYIDEIDLLLARLVPEHKRYSRKREYKGRPYEEVTWYFSGKKALQVRSDLPSKHPTWNLLWSMSQMEKLAFFDAAMKGDGSLGHLQFYQKSPADREWFQALVHMIGMQGRDNPKASSVACHNNPTTEFQSKHSKGSQDYDGLVWCVQVETGAFVARREGKIFVTGNSGFPKSHDISKGLDKAAGAEREVVAISPNDRPDSQVASGRGFDRALDEGQEHKSLNVTTPATPEAETWDGYGTALKPAWEPVYLCRAPRKGATFASLAVEYGSGALNIDGGRIGADAGWEYPKGPGGLYSHEYQEESQVANSMNRFSTKADNEPSAAKGGRWPANFVLTHHADCVKVGEFEVEGRVINRWQEDMKPFGGGAGEEYESEQLPDELVERFACVPECSVRQLDDQVGELTSGYAEVLKKRSPMGYQGGWPGGDFEGKTYGDTGGPSRFFYCGKASRREKDKGLETFYWKRVGTGFEQIALEEYEKLPKRDRAKGCIHPTVKPIELLRYLATLILPPEQEDKPRRILIPFSGSGSEVIAARQAGWDEVVGIEMDKNYNEIAHARLAATLGMF